MSDILVLGGGLAGTALALHLAHARHHVALVEQHATPRHKVCGDFLSAEALASLHALGLDPHTLGAVPLTHLRLATGTRLTETRLPFAAASLTRYTLDEALLRHAAQAGVTLHRGQRIESLTANSDGWRATLADTSTLDARTVFLATGKHDLRAHPRPAGRHTSLVAFKLYLRLTPSQHAALGPAIELTLFLHGYAGLQPVEPDAHGPRANLCLVIEKARLQRLGNTWPKLLAALHRTVPHLSLRLAAAEPLLGRPLALSNIPYGLLRRDTPAPGLWPLGDQAVVIPSLTGDGMSLALHTATLAAQTFLTGQPAATYLQTLHGSLSRQLTLATLTSRLAVRPALQPVIARIAQLAPSLLTSLATATRIPNHARLAALPILGETTT